MSERKPDRPAFPGHVAIGPAGDAFYGFDGMTIRQAYKKAVAAGIEASCSTNERMRALQAIAERREFSLERLIALMAAEVADALIAEDEEHER